MRRSRAVLAAATTAVAATVALLGGSADAAGSGADLAASGYAVGGLTSIDASRQVTFVFAVTDRGPRAIEGSADLEVVGITNADLVDQVCVLANGHGINSDGPYCESGGLAVGRSHRMIVTVQPQASGTPVTVRVCVSNEDGIADPVSRNDCRTATVSV